MGHPNHSPERHPRGRGSDLHYIQLPCANVNRPALLSTGFGEHTPPLLVRTFPRGPEPCPEELCQWRPCEPQILSSSCPPAHPSTLLGSSAPAEVKSPAVPAEMPQHHSPLSVWATPRCPSRFAAFPSPRVAPQPESFPVPSLSPRGGPQGQSPLGAGLRRGLGTAGPGRRGRTGR